jgi:hypothetical protein
MSRASRRNLIVDAKKKYGPENVPGCLIQEGYFGSEVRLRR